MATTTYSSAYTYKNTYKYRAMLSVTTSESATAVTVSWRIEAQAYQGYLYTISIKGSNAISGSAKGYFTASNKPGSNWKMVPDAYKTGSFTITKGTSKISKTLTATAYGTETKDGIGAAGGSGVSTSQTVTAAALASYAVSFNANGGSGAPPVQTKYYGKTLTLSSTKPTRTGYTFLGWSTSSTATSATYAAGGSYTSNSKATLYAVWKAVTYTISYNGNGYTGGTVPSNQTKTYGVTLTLSSSIPTRTNYKFLGWATSSTATSAAYQPGGSFTINAATTLYAVWQYDAYTIAYDTTTNGGSGTITSQTAIVDTSINLNNGTGVSSPTNYFLECWNTNANGTGTRYELGQSYSNSIASATAITLYAIYKQSYLSPTAVLTASRIDAYGNNSSGGKRIKFNYQWSAARDASNYYGGSYTLVYSNDEGANWTTYETGTFNTSTQPSNGNDEIIISETDPANMVGNIFKLIVEDTTSTSDIHGSTDTVVESSQYVIPVREGNIKEPIITNFKINRLSISSTTVNFSFDWVGYYDGNEYYDSSTQFKIQGIPYKEIENVLVDDDPLEVIVKIDNEQSGSTSGFFVDEEGVSNTGIPVNKSARFYNIEVISKKGQNEHIYTPTITESTVPLGSISYGGFPVHINGTGEGISLFGIADQLKGFEVNGNTNLQGTLNVFKETSLQNTLEVNGVVNLRNTLEVNGTLNANGPILAKKVIEVNNDVNYGVNSVGQGGTWITAIRTDKVSSKKSAISLGVGTGGENMGLYSLRSDNWLFYQNGSGEVHVNSTGQIWVDSGDYINIKSRSGVGSGFIVRYPNSTPYFGFDHSADWTWHGLYSNINGKNSGYLIQKRFSDGAVYANSGRLPLNSNNVLLSSGGVYMSGSQDFTFSGGQTVVSQMLGVVLVWSHYTVGTGANDWGWEYTFIPKWHVQNHNGTGIYIKLQSSDGVTDTYKYIYLYDTHIKGNDINSNSGTGYDNRLAVLRAVIGV